MASFSLSLNIPKPLKSPSLSLTGAEPKLAAFSSLVVTGPSELSGHVSISGSKNAALPILAASLLCGSGACRIANVPSLSDTRAMTAVLRSLGADVRSLAAGELAVDAATVNSVEPDAVQVGGIRGGFFVIGPLLARFGEAVVALPGGCDIGARPVDLFVDGLRALGAVVDIRDGKARAFAANGRGLVGGKFRLNFPSVGATETLMMAATLAEGETVISNAAREPEVVALARFLTDIGACIAGAGSERIIVKGKPRLRGCECTIEPDRVETGTFMLAAAITRSRISLSPVVPCHAAGLTDRLRAAGCKIRQLSHDAFEVSAVSMNGSNLRGFDVKTGPFPAFPTDLQPLTMSLLTTCDGFSVVEESVFNGRMGHTNELIKLGAKIQVCGNTALVHGKDKGSLLSGSSVIGKDLRGGTALVLAGLAATGTTEISGASLIDRGYERIDAKLHSLGADVKRLIPLPI